MVDIMLMINGTTTVRELLAAYPAAFAVLLRHGMCEDCRSNPPPVPLAHFAAKHCGGNLARLVGEIQGVIRHPG